MANGAGARNGYALSVPSSFGNKKAKLLSQETNRRLRILSGMRPTGKLHLGNLVGALQNWVKLQDEYESYHFVADWHMLTTGYDNTLDLRQDTWEMVTDWLACGLDPDKATFFVQSRLPEHAELHLLFSMVTPLSWLERVPTYKEQLENIRDHDINTYGFLGYPLLQAADILMYKPKYVPVGEDQVPHVEFAREVARRFNLAFGELEPLEGPDGDWASRALMVALEMKGLVASKDRSIGVDIANVDPKKLLATIFRQASLERRADCLNQRLGELRGIFPEPEALLTSAPRLPGTDGRKMSKSYGNAIFLTDSQEVVSKKLAGYMTDPARKRRTDPGNPDVCPVFDLHKIFSAQETIERVNRECRTAEIGCVECKKLASGHLSAILAPIQERRKRYEQNPQEVWDILEDGTRKARVVAQATMREVRAAVKLT
jgi:tryptophanyl-tRNA synthetase